jgi:hypothetical protein
MGLILRQLVAMREDNAANTPELKKALAQERQKGPTSGSSCFGCW